MSSELLRSEVAFLRGRIALAFEGPYGSVAALVTSRNALAPETTMHLGAAPSALPVLPRVVHAAEGLVALFCDEEGVRLRALPGDAAVPVASGGRALGLGVSGQTLAVAVVDAEGLHLTLHRGAVPSEKARVTAVARADLLDAVELVRVGTGWQVFYAPTGEAALGVVRWDAGGVREVRHPLSAPVTSLHAATTGRRTAVAIGHDTDEVELAVLDVEGNMRERPHVVLREQGAVLEGPRVLWTGRGFSLTAVAREEARLLLRPTGEGVGARPLELRGVHGAHAVGFSAGELLVASVEAAGDEAHLVVRSCDREGGGAQSHRIPIAPPDAGLRGRTLAAATRLRETRTEVAASLYRDGGTPTVRLEPSEGFRAHGPLGAADLQLRPHPDAGFRIVVSAHGGEAGGEHAPASLTRLAHWVRTTFSSEARAQAAADRAFAEAAVEALGAGVLDSVARAGETLHLTIDVDALPEATRLRRLLAETVAHRGAGLLTSEAPSAKPPTAEGDER